MNILVVHPAQQHSYRMATALFRRGYLDKYITTVYCKRFSWTSIVSVLLRGKFKKKAQQRVCLDLPDHKVIQMCEIEGLFKLLTMNISFFRPLYRKVKYHTADRFAKKVVSYVKKNHVDIVVSYDDCSSLLFQKLKEEAPDILRVMDVSAANVLYMKSIYEKDIQLKPKFASLLRKEREIVWNSDTIARTEKELKNTQIFLAPSMFVSRSLQYSGINESSIRICPYGVDTKKFALKEYYDFQHDSAKAVQFVYVGGVKELKGISYLLEAISRIPKEKATLVVVGTDNVEDGLIEAYRDRVVFTGSVLHSEVSKILMESDVYVFPSLGEGLSLSTLEAASCGLPLIVTENSGVNDAMTEGKEGYVISIQSADELEQSMWKFINNPQQIKQMGLEARKMALRYTWDTYYEKMGDIFEDLEKLMCK